MRIVGSIQSCLRRCRNGIVLALALAISLGGAWMAVGITTERLLIRDAVRTAEDWASLLVESVPDLEQIAGGETPSTASMAFFQWVQGGAGEVFRYKVFNRQGYSQLVSENGIALVNVSEFDDDAVLALKTGQPVVFAKHDRFPGRPAFYSEAYVPVYVDGRPIAVVEAYVDQSLKAADFRNTFLIAAIILTMLTAVSFGPPAFALYRRTDEKLRADEQIRFLARHDGLTGLLNRNCLTEELERAIAPGLRGRGLAVHFINLDRFKEVNDSRGHAGGDLVLKTVAERLREVAPEGACVARLGGDEFVVVQLNTDSRTEALRLAERISAALTQPVRFGGQALATSASIGVARAPADGTDAERLLTCADLAMHRARTDGHGGGIKLFEPEMDGDLRARLRLEKAVRNAIADDRLEVHYQPIFELASHQLSGFEALVRMRGDDGTLVPPSAFIPVAEHLRLIDKIGEWVLREACRTAAAWPNHLSIAVNLSPAQFALGSVSDMVADALKASGLEPHRLELEVTESLLMAEHDSVFSELSRLKEIGVAIVMDDFGTGYSSLSYLWQFQFSKIKIDRSFMRGFDKTGHDAETVVRLIVALGKQLGMKVTVEGVETAQHAAFVHETGADFVQGFLYGRPVRVEDVASVVLGSFRNVASGSSPEAALLRRVK